MDKMSIYNQARQVPEEAKKKITAGKLKDFTNVNPQYRIKRLTELFGPCGTGWWYEITDRHLQPLADGQIFCFVDINLYYKTEEGEVSQPIPGTGGSSFVASTRNGLQASDECYKMALTDAISVAAKALGVAADVYWSSDLTKYDAPTEYYIPYPAAPAQAPAYQPQPYVQPQGYTQPAQEGIPYTGYDPMGQPQPAYTTPEPTSVQGVTYPAPQPMPAPQPVPEMTQQVVSAQPMPSQVSPVEPQTAAPNIMTLEQAKAVVATVGYTSKGRALGDIINDPRANEVLNFVAHMAPSAEEKEAARLLMQSLYM